MAQPYIGEIRMFGGNFAPAGWAFCAGQQLPISENEALFNLIGTTYGGDGEVTFGLPNLCGRVPIHMGPGPGGQTYQIGEAGGLEQVTLTGSQLPTHGHPILASTNTATTAAPANQTPAAPPDVNTSPYGLDQPQGTLAPGCVQFVGGSQPHENMAPYLAVSFIISLYGLFPHQ
jgi:microcystin-dependent protein